MAAADRWAPWIEPQADQTGGALVVNAVPPVALPGTAVTFTPHLNCRALVAWVADVECTTPANVVLAIKLLVNAVAVVEMINVKASAALNRLPVGQAVTVDLVAGTTYAFTLTANLTGAGAVFNVYPTHTHLGPIVVMPNLHS